MAQKASHSYSQPSAPALSHTKPVHLHQANIVSQQPANVSKTSPNTAQSALDGCSDQPLQPAAGTQLEEGNAQLKPSETLNDQHQLEGSQDGSRREAEADLQRLEQEFVHDVYNAIAPHFSATRFAIWPKVMCTPQAPACFQ